MAQVTSAMAAKALRKLNERRDTLLTMENKAATFVAAIQEDIESVRPSFDFGATQEELAAVEEKIRVLKHTINRFNLTQTVPGFDMTIDQMLIYIPQLTERKRKLENMRTRLPKEREQSSMSGRSAVIEYKYANYDIQQAEAAYNKVVDELSRAQNALDSVNATVFFEAELE